MLQSTAEFLGKELNSLEQAGLCSREASGVLFVDDGSSDSTWRLIQALARSSSRFNGLSLSRNKGHQAALMAGLETAQNSADVIISVDADLQDDIAVCTEMLGFYLQGYDIVYGVRADRSSDSKSKRFFAGLFYSLMIFMGVDVMPGHGDFRMMSRRVLGELRGYRESSLFLRGIIPLLGYRSAAVYYERKPREAGETKYPFRKSLSLAVDGIVSFSNKPLRLISYMGIGMAAFSFLGLLLILFEFIRGRTVQGWTSLMVVTMIIGGAQLLALGIVGEYLGRAYRELKRRPRFHLNETCGVLMDRQRGKDTESSSFQERSPEGH